MEEKTLNELFTNWNSNRVLTGETRKAILGMLDGADDRLETACTIIDIVNTEAGEAFTAGFNTALALMGGVQS